MKLRKVLLASAIGLYMAAPTWATDLATDAKSFGARDAVIGPDLSADGSQVIYVTPGPGRKSIAVIGNLDAGKFSTIASWDGNPEQLRWCNFGSATRSVCQIGGGVKNNLFEVLSFSRLV